MLPIILSGLRVKTDAPPPPQKNALLRLRCWPSYSRVQSARWQFFSPMERYIVRYNFKSLWHFLLKSRCTQACTSGQALQIAVTSCIFDELDTKEPSQNSAPSTRMSRPIFTNTDTQAETCRCDKGKKISRSLMRKMAASNVSRVCTRLAMLRPRYNEPRCKKNVGYNEVKK